MSDVLVGIDVGTTGVKAVASSPRGELLGVAEEGYPLSTPRPRWSEQDPDDWWRAAQAALARLPEGYERFRALYPALRPPEAA